MIFSYNYKEIKMVWPCSPSCASSFQIRNLKQACIAVSKAICIPTGLVIPTKKLRKKYLTSNKAHTKCQVRITVLWRSHFVWS